MAKAKNEIGENVRINAAAGKNDLMIIAKLQKVALNIGHIKVNTLAKKFLHEKCDEYMKQNNITFSSTQPTCG
ncbi:MAG: hypothetical protein ABSB91_00345 [Sedimentisphaerales bacterium]|jgi:hypothetical protein